LDPNTEVIVRQRLRELWRQAAQLGAAVTVDMEQNGFRELTLEIFRGVLTEDEFRVQPYAAIALQAYLKDSAQDVSGLIRWARSQRRRIGVRLVKGAYWDSEIAWAKQKNWPIPVFLDKAATDANYEQLSRMLLEAHDVVDAAFGSHNLRSLAHAIVAAKEIGVPVNGYEMQMLYGMAEPVRQAIIQNGQRVRVYLPAGELLPGISYLIRRLMENTSNTSFLRQTYAEKKAVESLIKAPAPAIPPDQADDKARGRQWFHNEALIDFSQAENRQRFAATIQEARGEWQKQRRRSSGGSWIESVNPADPNEVVGRVRPATIAETEKAMDKAARFFPVWRATSAAERLNQFLELQANQSHYGHRRRNPAGLPIILLDHRHIKS
jgi:RHH-type proline utilization regulon transcriptional repressor/proline dehydrogenase/delta 1-pyrroline-5-carboxylate dehydrogenase